MSNNEFMMTDPDMVQCVKIKVPVVIAEAEASVTIDNTFCLPELAKKIDHIDATVRDFEADPVFVHQSQSNWSVKMGKKWPHFWDQQTHHGGQAFINKVIVHGVLHKQIFYVNADDAVKHVGEDVPFTSTITLADPEPVIDVDDVIIQTHGRRVDITWDLVRASRLHQTGVVIIRIKVVEERQIFVQVCPPPDLCPKNVNFLRDPGFEQWVGDTPLLWGATNVFRVDAPLARSGNHAAGLGANPVLPAAVFQTTRAVRPGFQYRLCVFAQRLAPIGANCDFVMELQMTFYDAQGNLIDTQSQSFAAAQIPTSYRQFCLNVGPVVEGTAYALVRIAMQVPVGVTPPNNCQLIIDDASLMCVSNT